MCWLWELLLDCDGLVPSLAQQSLEPSERAEIHAAAMLDDDEFVSPSLAEQFAVKQKWRDIFGECRQAARKACENVANNVPEDAWQCFINAHVPAVVPLHASGHR